jgi:hypothetical protein
VRNSFADHTARLTHFVSHAAPIIEQIEARLLNVQGKDLSRSPDRRRIAETLDTCFGESRALGRVAAARIDDGFEPVPLEKRSHELDPIELVARAYDHWTRHRWPGRNGRLSYAAALYSVCMIRQLEHLSLQLWDDGADCAPAYLHDLQRLLDDLNTAPAAVFVRDARWLIQTAQGPLTRDPRPYFRIAAHVSGSFADVDRVEIHKAGATLAGGHLRSQLLYRAWEAQQGAGDPDVLLVTRNSNSMDVALLVQDLVALLEAYDSPSADERRLDLADAIVQGISADPDLLLVHPDLLLAYTTIEEVFVERDDNDRPRYTSFGERHRSLVERYRGLIARASARLRDDLMSLDPTRSAYSPLGIAYGFCADILANMAIATLASPNLPALSLEDMFDGRGDLETKQALAHEWQQLPRKDGELEHFAHSIDWARQLFTRTMDALGAGNRDVPRGRLFVVPEFRSGVQAPAGAVAAQEHCITSNLQHALTTGATAFPKTQILLDRREGRYLASAEAEGRWFCVSKAILTACTSRGQDALITGVPAAVVDGLRLTCADIVEVL